MTSRSLGGGVLPKKGVPHAGTYERVGISLVKVYERVGKSVTGHKKDKKGQQMHFMVWKI